MTQPHLVTASQTHNVITYSGFVQKSDCSFPDFIRTKLLLFPHFSRHLVHHYVNINITKFAFKRWNLLYNVFFYSKYRMGLKFLNSELQMLFVMNGKKINKCIGNQQCNRHLPFPGQHYSFQGFFQTFPYLWSFWRLFQALKISKLNSRTFHTFPGSVRTLLIEQAPNWDITQLSMVPQYGTVSAAWPV